MEAEQNQSKNDNDSDDRILNDGNEEPKENAYVLTDLDGSTKEIRRQREEAFDCLTNQAKRMKRTSNQKLPTVDKGCTVRVPVPNVDRGKGDARSTLGIVLDIVDDSYYRIGTRNGVLKQLYAR